MNNVDRHLRLTVEQRNLFLKAIREGKRKAREYKQLLPKTTTETYPTRLQYDMVNTEIEEVIKSNPHMQLRITQKIAGFHPYIVVQDLVRNIFILFSKLPQNKNIFQKSRYRGDYAASNFNRLVANGVSINKIAPDFVYQESFLFDDEVLPYGIIVGYDGLKDFIFEGALHPDQSDWIYKDNISNIIAPDMENVIPLAVYQSSGFDIKLELKPAALDEVIVKLKDELKES